MVERYRSPFAIGTESYARFGLRPTDGRVVPDEDEGPFYVLASDYDALADELAEAEAARLITRATLTDARRFVVMVCGETAPYAKIMLERIDKALADSQHRPADSASSNGP